jgi:hypothetical protein
MIGTHDPSPHEIPITVSSRAGFIEPWRWSRLLLRREGVVGSGSLVAGGDFFDQIDNRAPEFFVLDLDEGFDE